MGIQLDRLPVIAPQFLKRVQPLIVQTTLPVTELMALLQRSRPDELKHTPAPGAPAPPFDALTANVGDCCVAFVPPMAKGETAGVYALVMREQQLLGGITTQELQHLHQRNRCWSPVRVTEIMRCPGNLLTPVMSWLLQVVTLLPQLWRCRWAPASRCLPLMLEMMQRQSSWHLQGQKLLAAMAQAIAEQPPLPTLLEQLVQQVQSLLQADRVCIYQYQEDGRMVVQPAVMVPPYTASLSLLGADLMLTSPGTIANFQAGQFLNVPDVEQFQPLQAPTTRHREDSQSPLPEPPPTWTALPIKAKLALPIRLEGDRLWGLLVIHQCATTRVWQDAEVVFLQAVVLQLQTAMQAAQLMATVQRLQHEQERQKFQHQAHIRALEQAHRLKDDFLSTVSHELKTPLSSMKMITNLLQLTFQNPANVADDRVTQYLTILEAECDREIHLVNDLLITQHLDAGTHPLSVAKINLEHWLAHLAEPFQHRMTLNQQQFHLQLTSPLPTIQSDLFILNRILTELLNNACKYTPAGSEIGLTANLTRAPDQTPAIRLEIRNTGIEIAPDQIHRIFDTFYQVAEQTACQQRNGNSGSGLGLALVKRLVKYIGGTIWVESAAQQVQFFVELPLSLSTPVT